MLNSVALMGRLVADPELRQTPQGVSVTGFTIAVERNIVKQGQERQADFIDIVAWRGTAEFVCKYFEKGQMIALSGRIQTRLYQDKNENNRKAFEVVAEQVSFAGEKNRLLLLLRIPNKITEKYKLMMRICRFNKITFT